MTTRPSTAAPILAALALLLLPVGAYVGGYYGPGEYYEHTALGGPFYFRLYRYEWQVAIFRPAAWVEAKAMQIEMNVDTVP